MADLEQREALRKAATTYTPQTGLPLLAMQVFADWLDENGEPDLAFVYRWCGKWVVFPQPSPQFRRWAWKRSEKDIGHKRRFHSELPDVIYDHIPSDGSKTWYYRNAADAIEDLEYTLTRFRQLLALPPG